MQLINWPLLKNPINWAIVWLMVAFGVIVVTLLAPMSSNMTNSGNSAS